MILFLNYIVYAHTRLQKKFRFDGDKYSNASSRKTHANMFFGMIQAAWFFISIEAFEIVTRSDAFLRGSNVYLTIFGCVVLCLISKQYILKNYDSYAIAFAQWPPAKTKKWDWLVWIFVLGGFALVFYLTEICAKMNRGMPHVYLPHL